MAATDARSLRKRAMAAACTLLGIAPGAQAADKRPPHADPPPAADHWTIDTSFLRYTEADRIKVLTPQIGLRREFSDNRLLNILLTVDTITGSTPLGTLPATENTAPNTVTSASGRGTNPIIGKIPLSEMTDTRYAIDASWQQPLRPDYTGIFGVYASKETDFIALGLNTKVARDFNQKSTTLTLGLAPEFDISEPNGGLPIAFATHEAPGSIDGTNDTRWLLSGLAGITQVINRRTLMQFNYGLTFEEGYLNDPYKLLSVVNSQGDPLYAIYEKRPGHRIEHSFYWLTKYNILAKDVFSLALRYYTDDWGIKSKTLDFGYRRQSHERFYWEPHVRYYHQSSADFFRLGLVNWGTQPEFASADMRLAELEGITIGLRMGYTFKNGSELIVRGEYYTETGESKPPEAVGAQRAYDLFPTLRASIIQVMYRFQPAKLFRRK